jgi:hypothetical protein
MSDDFLIVVPRDPTHVPSIESQRRLIDALRRIAPNADGVTSEAVEHIRFFDAGENFERISCPSCHSELGMSWWQDRMGEDFGGQGFRLERYLLPCCGARLTLNELAYDWPQAFGRFSAEARNPNMGELGSGQRASLEQALGVAITVVRCHL